MLNDKQRIAQTEAICKKANWRSLLLSNNAGCHTGIRSDSMRKLTYCGMESNQCYGPFKDHSDPDDEQLDIAFSLVVNKKLGQTKEKTK